MVDEPKPKLQIDTGWKAEAQAEKERLAKEEEAQAQRGEPPRAGELPKADFKGLVSILASQAVMGLGVMGDSKTGRVVVDLPGARFGIDLLSVLEEKTKGNLTDEESKEMAQILAELRGRFVQLSQLVAQQVAASPSPPDPAGEMAGSQPVP